jgi:hypothetical protein
MTNYQEGSASFPEGAAGAPAGSYQDGPGYQAGPGYQGGGAQDTSQFQGAGQPPWQGGPGGGPGYQDPQGGLQGMFHRGPGGSRGRSLNVRSTFKTTELWVYVIAVIAILIAAAVTDQGPDNQGFGAQEAWKYVTWLTVAYLISRGLTKFGGHEHRDDHGHDHGQH